MAALSEIRVPRETVNDDTVKVIRWLAAEGDLVRTGMSVVELETSKSVIDVEAPAAGRLMIRRGAGEQVPIGELLGVIGDGAAAAPAVTRPVATVPTAPVAATPSGPTISAKARELMNAHGLEPAAFAHLSLVREADVRQYIAERTETARPADSGAVASGRAADVALPRAATPSEPWRPKGLFGDAAQASSERGTSVIWLALNYLWRNWLLGNLVRVAPRGVINVLHRWRGVRMGHDCFIDPNAILETAYPENITLGNDVRVTAGVIVMTHIKAPHYLRDRGFVPVVLKPVVLEDHCFVGVNAVILPGVTVGRAAVVASGAVVSADVPPLTMVAGNPAKVVRRFEEGSSDA
jgi:acetyltransferase-like isoleucine patch superfamily enzyme